MRVALVALALLAATPATAGAQFGQVEPLTLRGDDDCVRTTGAPGELALPATDGVRFAQAAPHGCPAGPDRHAGQGVRVLGGRHPRERRGRDRGRARRQRGRERARARRRLGRSGQHPVEQDWRADDVAATVSDRGDVIVTWREESTRSEGRRTPYRFRAVRAAPGAAFGAVETLGASSPLHEAVLPAIAATGEAFVLTSTAEGTGSDLRVRLNVYTGAPGAAFGAPTALGTGQWLSSPAIAAAPDGRVLVAFSDGTSQRVAERAPGGAFAPAVSVGDARDSSVTATLSRWARAARPWWRGRATRAATCSSPRGSPPGRSVRRPASASPLLPEGFDPFYASRAFFAYIIDGAGGLSYEPAYTDLVLTGDGRAALAWFQGESATIPALLTTPLSGGARDARTWRPAGSSPRRRSRALTLADGTPALAWTEPGPGSSYRLHLAAEGVVDARTPAAARDDRRAPVAHALRRGDAALPVRCDGPCEVGSGGRQLHVRRQRHGEAERAGTGVLSVRGAAYLAPPASGRCG